MKTYFIFKSIFDKFNGYQPVPYNYNVHFQYGECVTTSTALACTKKSHFEKDEFIHCVVYTQSFGKGFLKYAVAVGSWSFMVSS